MNTDKTEQAIFEKVLNLIKIPEPDDSLKQEILKVVYFLMIAKEIALFNISILGILLDDKKP